MTYGGKVKTDKSFRKSNEVWLNVGENALIKEIEKRIQNLTKVPFDHGEMLQVVHYNIGGFFNSHCDYILDPKSPFVSRMITFLIYLNDVEEGGETLFPNLGIGIIPKKGRALLWYNCKGLTLPSRKGLRFIKILKKPKMHPDVFTCWYTSPLKGKNGL